MAASRRMAVVARVEAPTIDEVELFVTVSRRRTVETRTRLLQAAPEVFDAYERYQAAATNLAGVARAERLAHLNEALSSNYEVMKNSPATRDVRGQILRGAHKGRCPLCGQGVATTLDHYLPRAKFPEFSVFPLNLIPTCLPCNVAKREVYEENGEAVIIHAYLDDIADDARYLFVDLSVAPGEIMPMFYVNPPDNLDERLATRLRTHFSVLRLGSYYLTEGVNEISERRNVMEDMLTRGVRAEEIADDLRRDSESVASDKGINHWRSVILGAMAESGEVCSGTWLDDPVGRRGPRL